MTTIAPLQPHHDALFERELDADVRNAGNAELLDHYARISTDAYFDGDDMARWLNELRFRRIGVELDLRRRVSNEKPGAIGPDCERFQEWKRLASEIRERVDLPRLFDRLGYELRRAGTNGRRGAEEWAGACPLCAGTDRLRVWAGPNGRAWCRRCGWGGDAIVIARSFDRGLVNFYDAIRFLAEFVGLPVPDDRIPDVVTLSPSGAAFTPIRRGGRRVG